MEELLSELNRLEVKLKLDGDELRVSAPQGVLTKDLREALKAHKKRLVELLRQQRGLDEPSTQIEHDAENRHAPFALTELQHAYWLGRGNGLDMGSVATHLYVELDCDRLDIERANDALCAMIDRHDMLRAVVGGDGMQRVLKDVPRYRIAVDDQRQSPPEEAESAALKHRDALSHQVLKADRWPLFEIRATWMPEGRVRLHVSLDLLILDAWSIFLFFREWHRIYLGVQQDEAAPAITFRDYVVSGDRQGERQRVAREYWQDRLDSLPPAPELPLRADTAARRAPRFLRREARMEKTRWQQLKLSAQARGLTPSGLLMAAYSEVLSRWSASSHFTLNVTIGKRGDVHPDVHRLLGDFTTVLLQEVDRRDSADTFLEFAIGLQRAFLHDMEYSDYSGVAVMRDWARRRSMPLQATMPVVFSSGLIWSGDREVGNLEQFGRKVYSISQTSQVWLDHHVMELDGDLVLIWDAADAVFEPGVLDAMFEAYRNLVDRLADGDAWNDSDPVMLPEDMRARRERVDATGTDWPCDMLHAALVRHALAHPDAIAIESDARIMTFRDLLEESACVADWLLEQGVAAEQPVAIVMRKGWEQLVAALGILMAGAAYLPLDADLPVRRLSDMLRLGEVGCLLTQPGVLKQELTVSPDGGLRSCREIRAGEASPFREAHAQSMAGPLERLAYVIFTSGSTGVPKGVMIDHRGASNTLHAVNTRMSIGAQDKVLAVSSLSFDLSVYDIFGVLGAGGTIVIPSAARGHDPMHWRDLIERHRVTVWNSAPQLMRMLMDSYLPGEGNTATLSTVLLSGDFIPLDLPDRVRTRHPAASVVSLGGATEASIWSNCFPIGHVDPSWSSIPYGHALPNQSMRVYDSAMRLCPDHVKGRIHIGGIGLAKGYWRDAAKTAERFRIHPRTGERLYDTGDLGRYAVDGEIIILGRDDGQVKIRGHRVELGEIEAVLRRHPTVHLALVVATAAGTDSRQIAAYVQPAEDMQIDPAELRRHVAESLPDYMVPRFLVVIDTLPVTGNGKIDYAALPSIGDDAALPAIERVAPRTPTESAILDAWRRVIVGLDIGVTDNFFELGGDSILATELVRELNAGMGFALEMHELFECLTVEALAALYDQRQGDAHDARDEDAGTSLATATQLLADVETAATRLSARVLPAIQEISNETHQILLTGATGWLGSHVLDALLDATDRRILCLVRAGTPDEASQRIADARAAHGLAPLSPASNMRVEAICGRIDDPRLGLSDDAWARLSDVESIYHFAGSVNVLQDYATHRRHNVEPLDILIELAVSQRLKRIVTASPMTVGRRRVDGALTLLGGERTYPDPNGLMTAYAQSRWVSEQILDAAARHGIPVDIYRSSHALPAVASGAGKTGDTYTEILRVANRVDAIPDWQDSAVHGVPVDTFARLLVADALGNAHHVGGARVAHVENPSPPTLPDVVAMLHRLRHGDDAIRVPLPIHDWETRCRSMLDADGDKASALGRVLFGDRSVGTAVRNMFTHLPIEVGHFAGSDATADLQATADPEYWRRVLPFLLDVRR